MDEKNSDTKSQGSEQVETSAWAKRAIWCVGCGYIIPIIYWVSMSIISVPLINADITGPVVLVFSTILIYLSLAFIICGLIIAIIALIHIALSKGKIQGESNAINAILLSFVYLFLAGVVIVPSFQRERTIAYRTICATHLSELGKALKKYAAEHGSYPEPDKWCDILVQKKYVDKIIFKCPGNIKVRCSYSINPNCEPNSPLDTVLIFESKGGWNSYGGPELFSADHHEGYGGNILYNDGAYSFAARDPNYINYELNWGEKK